MTASFSGITNISVRETGGEFSLYFAGDRTGGDSAGRLPDAQFSGRVGKGRAAKMAAAQAKQNYTANSVPMFTYASDFVAGYRPAIAPAIPMQISPPTMTAITIAMTAAILR